MTEEEYEEYLNEEFTVQEIMGDDYGAGSVLRAVDPIAFRESFLDFLDSAELTEVE